MFSTLFTRRVMRTLTNRTYASHVKPKKEGDISSVFASLSGSPSSPLPQKYLDIKRQLIQGNEDHLISSWERLLAVLEKENAIIAQKGVTIIPQIEFSDLQTNSKKFKEQVRKRGVGVVRQVIPENVARQYKRDVEDYVAANPTTKAFPKDRAAVYELYWSPSQIRARSHPNLITVQRALMDLWHTDNKEALISTAQPLAYADRVRIRQPGDSGFALGPHIDAGSVERWEPIGYGLGKVYEKIWQGKWEDYDPWESSCRLNAVSDLYHGAGACSMFRMFQGWLSMSHTGPNEGTLMVNPLLQAATAYFLLRPFFAPVTKSTDFSNDHHNSEWLSAKNWKLMSAQDMTSDIQGATPGHSQELTQALHPHLDLTKTMIHIPRIKPGDYVIWHCDSIHAVDKVHMGQSDSSVLYIPVCPVTEANAEYVVQQRQMFLTGHPGPDFPGGKGESEHVGRPGEDYLRLHANDDAMGAMGFAPLSAQIMGNDAGAEQVIRKANASYGF